MKANQELADRYLAKFKLSPSSEKHYKMVADCSASMDNGILRIYFHAGQPDVTLETLDKWVRKAGLRLARYGWNEREGVRIVCEELR